MALRSGRNRVESTTIQTVLVVLFALVVVVGTVIGYANWRSNIDDQLADSRAVDLTGTATPAGAGASGSSGSPAAKKGNGSTSRPVVRSFWIGDGWFASSGAEDPETKMPCHAADLLGWRCRVSAQNGTGFVNDGSAVSEEYDTMLARLEAVPTQYTPDVVVIDAGRNDIPPNTDAQVREAMEVFLAEVTDRFPDAEVVQVVPFRMRQSDPAYATRMSTIVTEAMAEYDGLVLDPVADGWGGAGVTDTPLLSKANGQPTAAGYDYLADQLAEELTVLGLGTPPKASASAKPKSTPKPKPTSSPSGSPSGSASGSASPSASPSS